MTTSQTVPSDFSRDAKRSERQAKPFSADHIKMYPPTSTRAYWRLDFTTEGVRRERSGGTTVGSLYRAWQKAQSEIKRSERIARGEAELGDTLLLKAIEAYLHRGGPEGRWKAKTREGRTSDMRGLQELALEAQLACLELNRSHLRHVLTETCGTATRARTVKGVLTTFLKWGWRTGYFTQSQTDLVASIDWVPKSLDYTPAESRRAQATRHAALHGTGGGEVPTHTQVIQLAEEMGRRYTHGAGLVHVAANTGLRLGELLALSADRRALEEGRGNWVDLEQGLIHVHWQADPSNSGHRTTKTDAIRTVVIPARERIATGIDLIGYLESRCLKALEEQQHGGNQWALLFPDSKGGQLRADNFDSRYARPSFKALGWVMQPTTDAKGRTRSLSRFTMHSLRDRFATTALQEWGYNAEEIKAQGGWKSVETVYRHYVGNTDDTLRRLREIHANRQKA